MQKSLPTSLTDRIDVGYVEMAWQRRIDGGQLLNPGEPGYEEAQQLLAIKRREFASRFGLG